jgi:hypothetical protein
LPADFLAILNFCPSTGRFFEPVWTLVQQICSVNMLQGNSQSGISGQIILVQGKVIESLAQKVKTTFENLSSILINKLK